MEETIRLTAAKFAAAHEILTAAALAVTALKAKPDLSRKITAACAELDMHELRYALVTCNASLNASQGEAAHDAAQKDYMYAVKAGNFLCDVDELLRRICVSLESGGIALPDALPLLARKKAPEIKRARAGGVKRAVTSQLHILLSSYPLHNIRVTPQDAYDVCKCGSVMNLDPDRSELKCSKPNCLSVRVLYGTVFEDNQFYSQEGQKAKSGTFSPNRHFHLWWTHILAREPEEELGDPKDPDNLYGEKIIAELLKFVQRENIILRMLSIADVRKFLQDIDRSDLNKNAPLLIKKATGIGPPQPPDWLTRAVESKFSAAIAIVSRLPRPGRQNRDYYPFYIYKILDTILPPEDLQNRRILYYIHLQSRSTVQNDDIGWKIVCSELKDIKYKPTDRAKAAQYTPLDVYSVLD